MTEPLTDHRSPSLLGTILSERYRLDTEIARGGMGVIYGATQLSVDRSVAVKVIGGSGLAPGSSDIDRFEREARVLAGLQHPHIVSLLDYGQSEGRRYLVMERLEGESLSELIRYEAPVQPERVGRILGQLLEALSAAHSQRILHRDLKPSNVFLTSYKDDDGAAEFVKLLDFGIATELDGTAEPLTRAGAVIGSPGYLSPEQETGEPLSVRSDLFCVGLIGWELLTGARPFPDGVGDAEPPTSGGHRLRGAVVNLVMACLSRDPTRRPVSATEALAMLDEEPVVPTTAAELPDETSTRDVAPAAKPPASPRPAWLLPTAVAAVLVIAGLISVATRPAHVMLPGPASTPVASTPAAMPAPAPPPKTAITAPAGHVAATVAPPKATAPHAVRWTRLKTRPLGATVTDGTRVFGVTPLKIDWPAAGPPGRLKLTLEGHQDAELRLRDADHGTVHTLELSPVKNPKPKRTRSARRRPRPEPVLVR